jgi:hypothetical protein
MKYSPIRNQNKPFRLFGKRFNRNELESMGLNMYANKMVTNYPSQIHYNFQKELFFIRIYKCNVVNL